MKSKILLFSLLAVVAFSGCKKDEETTTTTGGGNTSANTTAITNKNWKLTAYTVNPAYDYFQTGTPVTNLIGALMPCELDNLYNLTTSNTYTIDEGATKCSA